MNKKIKKFPKLLIVGLLVMNVPVLIGLLIDSNGIITDIIDFFKGFGVALIIASAFLSAKGQRCKFS